MDENLDLNLNLFIHGKEEFTPAIAAHLGHLQETWRIIFDWVRRKKINSKYRIIGHRETIASYEPCAEVYFRILELAIQLHASSVSPYLSASHWFRYICEENLREQISESLAIAKGEKDPPQKTEAIQSWRIQNQKLRNFENPFSQREQPHLYLLIAAAIEKAESDKSNDIFVKKYWRPYLKALGNWLRRFERDPEWNLRFVQKEQAKRTSGGGRNRGVTLRLPP